MVQVRHPYVPYVPPKYISLTDTTVDDSSGIIMVFGLTREYILKNNHKGAKEIRAATFTY